MSALDTLLKNSAPAGGKTTKASIKSPLPTASMSNNLDGLISASKPGAVSVKSSAYAPLPYTKKEPEYNSADSTKMGIFKNTITGLPKAALDVAKMDLGYLYDTVGGIVAPGITHDELRSRVALDTLLGVPKSIYKTTKQIVTHPIQSAQAAVGGATRGVSDFVTNAIINLTPESVTGAKRDDLKSAVQETLDKYLSPEVIKKKSGDTAIGEGYKTAGEVAPIIALGAGGSGLATKLGAPALVGEATGFVSAGQTQLPLDASIEDRAKQAMQDLVGLGLFKLGSYSYMKAKNAIINGYKSHTGKPTAKDTGQSFQSSGHDLDRAIEAGDIPLEKVYKNKAGQLQPEYVTHVVSDLAGKLDGYKKVLGAEFKKVVDLSNPTPTSLDTQALNFLNSNVSRGTLDVVPTRETTIKAGKKPPLPTRSKAEVSSLEKKPTNLQSLDDLVAQSKPKNAPSETVTRETSKETTVAEKAPAEATPVDLEAVARVNPVLFRQAQKAKSVDEFIDSVVKTDKTTRENVSIPTLTEFYNKVSPKNITTPKTENIKPKQVELKIAGKVGPFYQANTLDYGTLRSLHGKIFADAVQEGKKVTVYRAGKEGEKLKDGTFLTADSKMAKSYLTENKKGFGGSKIYKYQIPARDLVSVDNLDFSEFVYKPKILKKRLEEKAPNNTKVVQGKKVKSVEKKGEKVQKKPLVQSNIQVKKSVAPKKEAEVRPLKPIGTGETKTSKLSLNIEQNAIEKGLAKKFGDLPEYQTVNLKEQAKFSADLLKNDPEKAYRIAMGEEKAPADILPEMVLDAVERQAIKNGDAQVLLDLANSKLSTEATAMGQRIRALGERDQESPVKVMQDVIKSRKENTKGRVKNVVEEIKKEIKKATPKKEDWDSFIKSIEC